MKKIKLFGLGILLMLFVAPLSVHAIEYRKSESIIVEKGEVINENFYASGSNIEINGVVDGDLIVVSEKLTINGRINGDLIGFVGRLTLNGEIDGNMRLASNIIELNGKIGRNFTVIANKLTMNEESSINEDMIYAGNTATINGQVVGNLLSASNSSKVNGALSRNAIFYTSALEIGENSNVGGNLDYYSEREAKVSEKAIIEGGINKKQLKAEREKDFSTKALNLFYYLFANLVLGLFLISLFKKQTEGIIGEIKKDNTKALQFGLLGMLATPLVAFLLIFTIIGLPVSILTFIVWGVLLYVSRIFSAIIFGEIILKKFSPKLSPSLMKKMIFGVCGLFTLCSIPVFGWVICLIAMCYGIGGIILFVRR